MADTASEALEFPPVPADCWFLSGPTASGKTAIGLELAQRLGAEILSLDSMAVYRGLDIGTAKPAAEERARAPHHLIDLVEPDEEFSVAQYLQAAQATIAAVRSRGKEVLFVGGTPLWLKACLRGIFQGPQADWELRRNLQRQAADQEPGYLRDRLAEVDPQTAQRLHPNDTRRLIRALEVYEKTGRPISRWQQQFDQARPAEACRVFVLRWPREELLARIDRRVEAMFAAGLVDEVRGLLNAGQTFGRTARQALGYREVLAHLRDALPLDETIEQVKNHTHQFARRQRTWFRSLSECRFVEMDAGRSTESVVEEILQRAQK